METQVLKLLLSLSLVDKQKSDEIKKVLEDLEKHAADLGSKADELRKRLSLALERPAGQKEALTNQLKEIETELGQVSKKAEDTKKQLELDVHTNEQLQNKSHKTGQESYNLRDIGEKVNQIGQVMTNAGQGITNSLMGSVNAYMAASGQFDAKTQRWNAAQQEIQKSYVRIGSVAIEKLTPYLEKAAKLLDKFASFVAQNPWIVEAAAGTAALLTVSGSSISALGTAMKIVGTVNALKLGGTMGGMNPGVGGFGLQNLAGLATNPIAVGIAALLSGAFLEKFVINAAQKANGQKETSWGDYGDTLKKDIIANPVGGVTWALKSMGVISAETAAQVWDFTKAVTGLGDDTAKAAPKINQFAQDHLQEFMDYQKQKTQAEQDFAKQSAQLEKDAEQKRLDIIRQFKEQSAQAEAKYRQESANAAKQFAQQQAQAAADYYRQVADAQAQYELNSRRAAEDHQKQLRQLEQSHQSRLRDLVGDLDALGIDKENADYKRQVGDANSQYKEEERRRKEDYQRQLAQMAQNFAAQQAQAARSYADQKAQRDQQYADQMAQLAQQEKDQLVQQDQAQKDQLAKLKQGYEDQMRTIENAFTDSINRMNNNAQQSAEAVSGYWQKYITDFQSWLDAHPFVGKDGTRALGGPVMAGSTYLVGERGPELFKPQNSGYVFPHNLTAQMLAGGRSSLQQGGNTTIRIETPNLSMITDALAQFDTRFTNFERDLTRAFA